MPHTHNAPRPQAQLASLLYMAAAFVVVVAGMRAAAPIVVPFLVSIFIAVLCGPLIRWLQNRGLPPWLALVIVICATIVVALGVVAIIGNSVNDFTQKIPLYQHRLAVVESDLADWLAQHGVEISEPIGRTALDPDRLLRLVASMVNDIGAMFGNILFILLTVVFLLLEVPTFPAKLRALPGNTAATQARFAEITEDIRQYMAIKTWVSLLTGVVVALLLWVIGVDYVLMWGLVAFFLNFVPNIGSIIAAVPAVLLALIQLGVAPAIYAAAGYLVLNTVIGNFAEPRLMGRGLGLSTFVVFVSLVFWGWVLGPIGMVLSVPLTMIFKILLQSKEQTRWMGVMLGNEAPGGG